MDAQIAAHQQFANYDRTLISTFSVVGSYFVDVFFNHIYTQAKANVEQGKSITDEYHKYVSAYLTGVKTDKQCYRDVITGVHTYFISCTTFTAYTFNQFVDRLSESFIPPEYISQMKSGEKDEILGRVIVDLVGNLAAYSTTPELLHRIIDNHDSQSQITISMMQNQAITIQLSKREKIRNQFLRQVGGAADLAPMGLVENLKEKLVQLTREKAEWKSKALKLNSEVTELKGREAKYKQLIALLKAERTSGPAVALHASTYPPPETLAEFLPPEETETPRVVELPPDHLGESNGAPLPPPSGATATAAATATTASEYKHDFESPGPQGRQSGQHERRRLPRKTDGVPAEGFFRNTDLLVPPALPQPSRAKGKKSRNRKARRTRDKPKDRLRNETRGSDRPREPRELQESRDPLAQLPRREEPRRKELQPEEPHDEEQREDSEDSEDSEDAEYDEDDDDDDDADISILSNVRTK